VGVHARALDQAALTTAVVLVHQAHHHHLPCIRPLHMHKDMSYHVLLRCSGHKADLTMMLLNRFSSNGFINWTSQRGQAKGRQGMVCKA
jgi:hypothetical protein